MTKKLNILNCIQDIPLRSTFDPNFTGQTLRDDFIDWSHTINNMVFDPVKYVYSIHPLSIQNRNRKSDFLLETFFDRFWSLVWYRSRYQLYTDGISVDRIRFVTRYHNNEPPIARVSHWTFFDDFVFDKFTRSNAPGPLSASRCFITVSICQW